VERYQGKPRDTTRDVLNKSLPLTKKVSRRTKEKKEGNQVRARMASDSWETYFMEFHKGHSVDEKYGPQRCAICKSDFELVKNDRAEHVKLSLENAQSKKVRKKEEEENDL